MKSFHPPLSQAFIKDRVRIDDPLRGYQIRHATGGWLQGFLVWTNFTVWTLDFQWDSTHPASGLPQYDVASEGLGDTNDDGTLSEELQALPRGEQDPLDGGTVLKQVAEISLLGGLGCGELLLRKAIEDICDSKTSDNCNYKYVVLQATEGSRRFYEKMGFVRVGAVCRYRWAEYCTKGDISATTGKKVDVQNVEGMEVDPKFHGYRHWTYTNESCKSLNAHGGPSVMMCLRLDDYDKDKRQTISELLQPHLVSKKPTIQLFGNVANPDSENLAPTRKSQRRSSGSWKITEQEEQEQQIKKKAHSSSVIGEMESSGTTSSASSRRKSNRSKRGRNTSLANSCYVLYGVEGGKNSSNKGDEDTKSGNSTKQKRQKLKIKRNFIIDEKEAMKKIGSQAVVIPVAASNQLNTSRLSSNAIQAKGKALTPTSDSSKIFLEEASQEVLPLSHVEDCNSGKIVANCNKKKVKDNDISVATRPDNNPFEKRKLTGLMLADCSSVCKMKIDLEKVVPKSTAAQFLNDANEKSIKNATGGESCEKKIKQLQSKAEGMSNVAIESEAPWEGDDAQEMLAESEDMKDSRVNIPFTRPSLSKSADVKSTKPIVEKTEKENSASLSSGIPPKIISRKRSRQRAMKISASKLFKQTVINNQTDTNSNFYNRVVVRRNVQSGSDEGHDRRSTKRRKDNFRWRYNGGLMIDHRYEFCYYFVLHYNESKKSMTIVPMVKDGVFERAAESEVENPFDERLLGRPRYQCNILETDKNWIRDAPLEEYAIVADAVAVFDTCFIAQEAWDIGGSGNAFVPAL